MNNKIDHRRQEVQQIVKNACDQLNAEGVDARNYVEQLAWLFFLKAFDEAEARREQEAAFDDKPYERRLAGEYAWSSWAKNTDHPDDMLEFVNGKLWTKLTSPDPRKAWATTRWRSASAASSTTSATTAAAASASPGSCSRWTSCTSPTRPTSSSFRRSTKTC